jgi:hypothetical protein
MNNERIACAGIASFLAMTEQEMGRFPNTLESSLHHAGRFPNAWESSLQRAGRFPNTLESSLRLPADAIDMGISPRRKGTREINL